MSDPLPQSPPSALPFSRAQALALFGRFVYLDAVTTLSGGTATALDSIPTDLLTDGQLALVSIAGSLSVYRLTAGEEEELSPDVIVPDGAFGLVQQWILQSFTAP